MDTFGEEKSEGERKIGMAIPGRAVNAIEIELRGQLAEALATAPMSAPLFIDDPEENDFDGLSLRTALDVQSLVHTDVGERWRRQIIVARELGPTITTTQYETACALEGIEPWPAGGRIAI